MKLKRLAHILIAVLILGGTTSSCSTLHGHWGIGGEYPGYGYDKPAPPYNKPPKKNKKHKKDKHKFHRTDWWDD